MEGDRHRQESHKRQDVLGEALLGEARARGRHSHGHTHAQGVVRGPNDRGQHRARHLHQGRLPQAHALRSQGLLGHHQLVS